MNASEAVESISMETPLIRILAVGVGVKVAQLVQFSHSTAGVVGIGADCGGVDGTAKGTISGRACSTTSVFSWRFQ